jgi:hypothetical protein
MDNQTSLPFAAGSETSREAAERMAEQPGRIRRDHESILNVLLSGPKTDKEIQSILNMSGDTQRPRRGELVAMGRVVNTGQRRERSALWALASMTQGFDGV